MNDEITKNKTKSELELKQQKPQKTQTQETQQNGSNKKKLTSSDNSK